MKYGTLEKTKVIETKTLKTAVKKLKDE